jgi:hypothetical protein
LPLPCGSGSLPWSWMTSRIAGRFATVFEVTARFRLCRTGVRVAGLSRLPLLIPTPHRGVFRVPSQSGVPRERKYARWHDPRALSSPSETTGPSCPFDLDAPARHHLSAGQALNSRPSGLLSWGCPKIAPPLTSTSRVHSRHQLPASGSSLPSARGRQVPCSFRPCRSSRLRRLSPRNALQVCCTLQPTMGFATFQVQLSTPDHAATQPRHPRQGTSTMRRLVSSPVGPVLPPSLPKCLTKLVSSAHLCPAAHRGTSPSGGRRSRGIRSGRVQSGSLLPTSQAAGRGWSRRRATSPSPCLPRDAPPFGVSPSPVAAPRHRGPCLLAVLPIVVSRRPASPPGAFDTPTFVDLEALLHRRVRPDAPRCHDSPPDTPMGLRRSQGSTRLSRPRPEGREAPHRSGKRPSALWNAGEPAARLERQVCAVTGPPPTAPGRLRRDLDFRGSNQVGPPGLSAVPFLSAPK